MISLLPTHIFAATPTKFTITPDKTEAHPGDTITYTVKMSAVQKIAGMKFKFSIPDGLSFVEGKEVDGLAAKLNAFKAEFVAASKVFIVTGGNYTSTEDTTLMTFKCSVNEGTTGNKEVKFIIDDEENFCDTSYNNIDIEYSNPGSNVTITIPSTGITLNKTKLSLEKGKSETLTATVTPENTLDKKVIWSSSDSSVATVDANGLVTAVSNGTVIITATTEEGGKTATTKITVNIPSDSDSKNIDDNVGNNNNNSDGKANGKTNANASITEKNKNSNNQKLTSSKTGDSSDVTLWTTVFVLSLAGVVDLLARMKKYKR